MNRIVVVKRRATPEEIEAHLLGLGGGNHSDNMTQVRAYPFHFLVDLSSEEFLDLVFLQTHHVVEIAPRDEDRRLRAIAARAMARGAKKLAPNWDLGRIRERYAEADTTQALPALLLRDACASERRHGGSWYIQDGCHRALAHAMAILERQPFRGQEAYVATAHNLA